MAVERSFEVQDLQEDETAGIDGRAADAGGDGEAPPGAERPVG